MGPRRVGARRVGPRRVGARTVGAQNFALFFSLSRHNFHYSFSLLGSSRGILVVFEAPGPSNVHVWSSRAVVCEPRRPGLVGPPGFHTTAREPKRAHLNAPALQTPPKFNERTPRERKKNENCGGRREKKERNFGRSGGGLSGGGLSGGGLSGGGLSGGGLSGGGLSGGGLSGGGLSGGGLSSGRVHRQWGAGFGVSGSVQVFRTKTETEQKTKRSER